MAHLDGNSGSGAAVAAAGHSHVVDMPQLDASSRSSVAADHSHAIGMAQLDTNGRRSSFTAADDKGHVVIDIDAGGRSSTGSDGISSCVVCMEPLEWVAVSPCGHRVVCAMCAARARSAPNSDHRCCICRTLCPAVVVTKAMATADDGEPTFSTMPAATQDGQVGDYWYCAAMSAYFDDERQYETTAKAAAAGCLKQQLPPSSAADEEDEGAQGNGTPPFTICCFYAALFGVAIGFTFAADATGWGQRVAIVLGSVALWVAVGSVFWFLIKNGYCCQQDDGR
ncbi:hypothetical protein E2562_005859 [Oryza meyeriana var. granulata]|uniref:RING-type domain-containing protein n=1 Tax=Oryza meyeriana var. granulata TaxID=110450 RepID=A0A6G1DUT5_9ORYZ|nr:hypothetical protein E2562_005859 [Oryza meyeriana var. granulata]